MSALKGKFGPACRALFPQGSPMAMADHNADAANEIARREASEAAKRLAQTHAREAEIAILLEAGAKIIKRQEDEITGLMLELGQAQQDIADCSEQVLK